MKNKLTGWKKICAFAYIQSMKSKAMKITIAILSAIALLSMPVSSLIAGSHKDGEDKDTDIAKVYYYDNTDIIGKQFAEGKIESELYEGVKYEKADKNDADYIDKLINREENENELFLSIEYCSDETSLKYGINIYTYYSEGSKIKPEDADGFAKFVAENTDRAVLKSAGVSEDIIEAAMKGIEYQIVYLDEQGGKSEDNAEISQFQYYFTLSCITILIFIVSLVGSKVSELIVTEKATRVMEYILTSVKPMAVLVGKVLASTLIMLTVLASVAVCFIISIFINNGLFPSDSGSLALPGVLRDLIDNGGIVGANGINAVIIVVIIVLGAIFYGCVAGIAGASVSKVEEMAEGMKIFTFAMLIGAYLPLFMCITGFASGLGWGGFSYVVYFLPLSSMFIVPQYLLFGNIGLGVAFGSIGWLIISIVLIMLLVNRVYEHMLYNNGATLTFKDIIGIAKKGRVESNE